jgi:3-isopropylmalate/(R)-2-methylmalate dehydratase small subunit
MIAPSFADIFFNNCFKNGLLPIVLSEAHVAKLFDEVSAFPGYQLTVDLDRQRVIRPQGEEIPFEVQAFRRYCLMNGLDDIGLTLKHADKIRSFEAARLASKPWLAHTMTESNS